MSDNLKGFTGHGGNYLGEGPLQLHGIGPGLEQQSCALKGLGWGIIGVGWKIDRHRGTRDAPANRLKVMDHLGQGDIDRILLSQNNHAERIPD